MRSVLQKPVSILIPAYDAAGKLQVCLESLARYAPDNCAVHILDDATPNQSIRAVYESMRCDFSRLYYVRSDVNRGFVSTCNWGCAQVREPGTDVLLLNSDTEATAGFLEEMQAVLYLHEKHAVVTPRSNKATIFSIPWNGEPLHPTESYELWKQIRDLLPRYQVMPTAVGFCMLLKEEILERFELFDEIYSPGYNEENDFICRINRFGYSALAANRSYVFHHEGSSFGSRRKSLDAVNRQVLLSRYPEYERKVTDYMKYQVDPVETFAALYSPHKPRILYDLFHLPPIHSGTSDFALNLLREVGRLVEDEYELYVGIGEARTFFAHELTGYRIYEDRPNAQMVFDLVYKPCHIFGWSEFRRMNRLAPRLSYTLLDIIGVRCDYLSEGYRRILFHKTAVLSDYLFAISEFSRSDFTAFYGDDLPMHVIYLGTNLGISSGEFQPGEYVLVMGNAFAHKGVKDALRLLGNDLPVVVLGGEGEASYANVRWLTSGQLSRQSMRDLLVKARVLVYPSHYEGFGLPVIDALALGKPVVVLDSVVNRELAEITQDKNLHRIGSLKQLREVVQILFEEPLMVRDAFPRRWKDAGEEYVAAFREILARDVDIAKLRRRWDALRTLESVSLS